MRILPAIRSHFRVWATLLLAALCTLAPRPLAATRWSTLFTAQDVRDHLSTPQGREQALDFCRRMGLSKVYLETFRNGYQADAATLKRARDFFRQAGLEVSGCVATTQLGKPSTGWPIVACYTNRANRQRLASIFKFTASLFDEIIIDDFFFTDCECSECSAARGNLSWRQYRAQLMLDVNRDDVLGPARSVNPGVKIILKFPQWYDDFQKRGYTPDKEAALFDRIWVGTETRDPSSAPWGHTEQYRGFFLFRWLSSIGGAKTGGGWFDPYGTDPLLYTDQALTTVLAGAPEIFLFHYGSLTSPQYQAQAQVLAQNRSWLDQLSKLAANWKGIAAYKPVSSDPGGEPYIFDQIGMLGIPLLPTAKFPANARAAIFAEYSMSDADFVPELEQFLKDGGTAFLTEGLAHRLNLDPGLSYWEPLELPKGELIRVHQGEKGRMVVFSDALPRLTAVDSEDRVEQPTPDLRLALSELRKQVANFTVTSLNAPPRVAIFPMDRRVAVVNFTELSAVCRIELGGKQPQLAAVMVGPGSSLASDGKTLLLDPHSFIVVEKYRRLAGRK